MFTYEIKGEEGYEVLHRSDGTWIPIDPRNRDYAEYLRYTAWVEAGNTPEDFWTQDDELETLEETQVTEEEEETTEGES